MVAKTAPLPNIRNMFVPDKGYIIGDADLAGADARVVAWEANDVDLMDAFDAGLKVHAKNALDIFGPERAGPDGKREPLYSECKQAVHGTNYVGSAETIAEEVGWGASEARVFQQKWFLLHPAIKDWHERLENDLMTKGYIENAFGYRKWFFERNDGNLLPKAAAWGPQSTVAITTRKGALQLRKGIPWVEILLQVHDSLVFQFPIHCEGKVSQIRDALGVRVPYHHRDLLIPWELKTSPVSWGECESRVWA